jgi:hypothetical protein
VMVMAASNRKDLEKKAVGIEDKLPPDVKSYILSFFGKIGTKDFKYSRVQFTDKKTGQTKLPTFYGNLMVLSCYMDRTKLTETIAINLLWHINVEATLTLARENPKSLAIPVKIQDPYGQWIEATPLQTVYAAGDRNPPNMNPKAEPFGLVERLGSCFEKPAHADKQIAAWEKDSQKATEETMAPYVKAINTTCQEIIESEEITEGVRWQDVLALPIFLQLAENFRQALIPNPNHVVRSGFLFSMQIFLDLIATFEANVNNDNVEDKSRPNLGGWWSCKSDALDAIVYPALQARSQRCDLGIFKKGIANVAEGQTSDRLDFSSGTPEVLSDIGKAHFFGFYGDKFGASDRGVAGWRCRRGAGGFVLRRAFSKLVSSKNSSKWIYATPATRPRAEAQVCDNVTLGSSSAANAPRR